VALQEAAIHVRGVAASFYFYFGDNKQANCYKAGMNLYAKAPVEIF